MKHGPALRSFSALAFLFLVSASAQAQSFRAYLSSAGNDANPCTLVSPCRLLPAALTAVASGGEIWMLDSANYNSGPVSITKSVTILAIPGAVGSVVALGGNAINITSAVTVTMRNLVIVPFVGGGGTNGIVMTAGTLTLENSVVANMAAVGISVTGGKLVLSSSSIRNNYNAGVLVQNGASAIISGSTITGNDIGVWVDSPLASTTTADVTSSTVSGNSGYGIAAYTSNPSGVVRVSIRDSQVAQSYFGVSASNAGNGGAVTLSLTNTTVSNHTYGVLATGSGAKVLLSANTVSDNATGLYTNGGLLETGGDNMVRNNGTNQSGTVTPVSKL